MRIEEIGKNAKKIKDKKGKKMNVHGEGQFRPRTPRSTPSPFSSSERK